MRWTRNLLFSLGLGLGLATPAAATITGGVVTGGFSFDNGGTFVKLTPPFTESDPDNTVGSNNFNDLNLYGFDEDQNIVLAAPLSVNVLADGLGGGGGAGQLAAGTTVASHYVFYDPAGSTTRRQIATVTFDSDVLAILTSRANLEASDFLANTGVTYLSPGLRGLEGPDTASISNFREIALDWSAGTPGDYIRVLTTFSPVPEPAPLALWAFAGLAWRARRRR